MSQQSETKQRSPVYRLVGLAVTILAVVIISGLMDAGDVAVFSLTVPTFLVALVMYLLGAVAVWALERK